MKVNFQTLAMVYPYKNFGINSKSHHSNAIESNALPNDIFVRNINQPSFTSNNEDLTLSEKLTAIGVIGVPFLLSIGAGSYAMAHMDVKDIFLPDGTYLMSLDDSKLETNTIKADGDTGSFKIEGTGIDIQPEKYDVAIPEKGIFKNYDGSVDIDLLNHKYIDAEHKIFIDPEHKISAISDGTALHNIVIPNIDSPNFMGHSFSNDSPISIPQTRSEYIHQHGHAPENDAHFGKEQYENNMENMNFRQVFPDDNRSWDQKLIDFFNPLASKYPNPKFDKSQEYDIFGREIFTIKDDAGNITRVALDEKMIDIANKYDIDKENISEIVKFADNIRLKEYLVSYHPNYSNMQIAESETMQEFLNRVHTEENHTNDIEHNNDNDTDTPETDYDNSDIIEVFSEILKGIS